MAQYNYRKNEYKRKGKVGKLIGIRKELQTDFNIKIVQTIEFKKARSVINVGNFYARTGRERSARMIDDDNIRNSSNNIKNAEGKNCEKY